MKDKFNIFKTQYVAVYDEDSNVEVYKDTGKILLNDLISIFVKMATVFVPVILAITIVKSITHSADYSFNAGIITLFIALPILTYLSLFKDKNAICFNAYFNAFEKPENITQEDWNSTILDMIAHAEMDEKGRYWFTAQDNKKLNNMSKTENEDNSDSINEKDENNSNIFNSYIDKKLSNKSQIVQ